MKSSVDYYSILKLANDASPDQVHHAYRALAREYHPDRNPTPEARSRMTLINEAFECLKDLEKRRAYDRRFSIAAPPELQRAVLAAADEVVGGSDWRRLTLGDGDSIMERKDRKIFLRLSRALGDAELDAWAHASVRAFHGGLADCSVVLAYKLLVAERIPNAIHHLERPAIAIDLLASTLVGAEFPDPDYGAVFERLLME